MLTPSKDTCVWTMDMWERNILLTKTDPLEMSAMGTCERWTRQMIWVEGKVGMSVIFTVSAKFQHANLSGEQRDYKWCIPPAQRGSNGSAEERAEILGKFKLFPYVCFLLLSSPCPPAS